MTHERPAHHRPDLDDPLYPAVLPPELADFLKDHEYACVTQATDLGTAFVMKVPGADILSIRGTVPIHLRQELYAHPTAPVIRLVFTIYDQPDTPLAVETFINVGDTQQRADYATLADQEALHLLFYVETLTHRITKVVPYHNQADVPQLLRTADELLGDIPEAQRDFDAAKAAVIGATQL